MKSTDQWQIAVGSCGGILLPYHMAYHAAYAFARMGGQSGQDLLATCNSDG